MKIKSEWLWSDFWWKSKVIIRVCNLDWPFFYAEGFYWKGHLFWRWTGEWLPLFIMALAWVLLNWEATFSSTSFWQQLEKSLAMSSTYFWPIIGVENRQLCLGTTNIFYSFFVKTKNLDNSSILVQLFSFLFEFHSYDNVKSNGSGAIFDGKINRHF